jgi:hypothetical protein
VLLARALGVLAISLTGGCSGCSTPTEIDVLINDGGNFQAILHPQGSACTCPQPFLDVGECQAGSDAQSECACTGGENPNGCVNYSRLFDNTVGKSSDNSKTIAELDNAQIHGEISDHLDHDGVLKLDGCGTAIEIPLKVSKAAPDATSTLAQKDEHTASVHLQSPATLAEKCDYGDVTSNCCGIHASGDFDVATGGNACDVAGTTVTELALLADVTQDAAHARVYRVGPALGVLAPCIPVVGADGLSTCAVCGGATVSAASIGITAIAFDAADPSHVRVSGTGVTIEVRGAAVSVTVDNALAFGVSRTGTSSGSVDTGAALDGSIAIGTFASASLSLADIAVPVTDDADASQQSTVDVSFHAISPPVVSIH